MKSRLPLLALVAAAALAGGGCAATRDGVHAHGHEPPVETGADFFYDDLGPHGLWVDVSPYGTAWCPADVPYGWRPYTVGYWAYTDYGWMWISEDPWGWVPYHYGRWTFDPYYGWIWIPGDVWAPAWVAWRYGTAWVGWAPLPPEVQWRTGVGLYYSEYDLDQHIEDYSWSFSPTEDFVKTRERVHVEPASKNVTLLQVTRNVTKYGVIGTTPVERGLRPAMIEGDAGRRIVQRRVTEADASQRGRGVVVREGDVAVYRPEGRITSVVRTRVKDAPPEEKPVPSRRVRERAEEERRKFEEQVRQDRERLEQEQQRELRERPPGISAQELRHRQEAELRAQQEVEQREKKALEERERRLKEALEQERERPKQPQKRGQERERSQEQGGR